MFQGGIMLIISFFSDAVYFYINLYQITGDYNDIQLYKYKYFTRTNLKEFEAIVDDIILLLKQNIKQASKEKKDKSKYLSANGNY